MLTQDYVDELRAELKQARMQIRGTLRRALKAEQERDDFRAAIAEAHRILMGTYTEDEATPLHEELLPLLAGALARRTEEQ